MTQSKKWIASLLALVMLLQLAACNRAPAPSAPETTSDQIESSGTEEKAAAEKDENVPPAVGEEIFGFTFEGAKPYGPLNAQILWFTHEKSGA